MPQNTCAPLPAHPSHPSTSNHIVIEFCCLLPLLTEGLQIVFGKTILYMQNTLQSKVKRLKVKQGVTITKSTRENLKIEENTKPIFLTFF